MSDEKKPARDELDSFWKLDYLIPDKYSQNAQNQSETRGKQAYTDTSAVEITVPIRKVPSVRETELSSKNEKIAAKSCENTKSSEKSTIESIIKTLNMKRASELFPGAENTKSESREKPVPHRAPPFDPSEIKITRFDQLAELISEGSSHGRRLALNRSGGSENTDAANADGTNANADKANTDAAGAMRDSTAAEAANAEAEGEKIPPRSNAGGSVNSSTQSAYSGADNASNGTQSGENRLNGVERPYTPSSGVVCEYSPKNPLISSVRVSLWPSRYTFYERFRSDAAKYFYEEGKKTEFVPFFAYIPQYQQLNHDQRRYYFWWRECIRHGEYPRADISYILLYVYEIINLPELIPPDEGSKLLCDVWLAYRAHYPKLDGYLSEWYCDYCLVNRTEPDLDRLSPALGDIITAATFKEFYIRAGEGGTPDFQHMLLMFYTCSYYNYKAGRYYSQAQTADSAQAGGQTRAQSEAQMQTAADAAAVRAAYDTHIPAAFEYAVKRLTAEESGTRAERGERGEGGKSASEEHSVSERTVTGKFAADERKTAAGRLTRDAFSGSLCAYNIKRRIDIEYVSYLKPSEFRMIVTDMIKYAENKVRALLGIKARLGTPNIDDGIKAAISEYFAPFRNVKNKPKKAVGAESVLPEYEKFYEAESVGISPERAAEIEKLSWSVTEMLVTDETVADESTNGNIVPHDVPHEISAGSGLNGVQKKALEILAENSKASGEFVRFARESRIIPEALCEQINEITYELIGDSVILANDGEFVLAADYIDEIKEMIS